MNETKIEIVPGKYLSCRQGDISECETDAIVNAANNHLWMGSGVAGAIKLKGGQSIEDEAVAKGPIPVGEAVVTAAGKLKASHVIHAAAMGQDLRTSADYIVAATLNSLKRAEELKLRSIAFPALGTGVGGFSITDCAKLTISTSADFLRSSKSVSEVIFVLYDSSGFEAFAGILESFDFDHTAK